MNCGNSLKTGNACGICKGCEKEKAELEARRPVSLMVNEAVLEYWEASGKEPQLAEICRLARLGLWSERFQGYIVTALTSEMGKCPRGKISGYERALDALPGKVK